MKNIFTGKFNNSFHDERNWSLGYIPKNAVGVFDRNSPNCFIEHNVTLEECVINGFKNMLVINDGVTFKPKSLTLISDCFILIGGKMYSLFGYFYKNKEPIKSTKDIKLYEHLIK